MNRDQAIEAMREGKSVGFKTIPNVKMFLNEGYFWFKRKGHKVEKLDERTIDNESEYVIMKKKGQFKTR